MRIAMLCFLCKEDQRFLCESNLDKNLLEDIEKIFELNLKPEEFKLCLRCFTLSVSLRDINKITTLKRTGCGICSSKNILNKSPDSYQSILLNSITFQVQNFRNAKFCCDCLLQVQNITSIENLYKKKKESTETTTFKIKPISILLKRVDSNVQNIDINRTHPQGEKRKNYNIRSPRTSHDNSISPSTSQPKRNKLSNEDCSASWDKNRQQSVSKRQTRISFSDDDSVSRTPVPTKRKISLLEYSNSSQSDGTENILHQATTVKQQNKIVQSSPRRISNRQRNNKKRSSDSAALNFSRTRVTRKNRSSISRGSNASQSSDTSSLSTSEEKQNVNTKTNGSARKMQRSKRAAGLKKNNTSQSVNQKKAISNAKLLHEKTRVTAFSPPKVFIRHKLKLLRNEVMIISSDEEEVEVESSAVESISKLNKKKQNKLKTKAKTKSELKKIDSISFLNALRMKKLNKEKNNTRDDNSISPQSDSCLEKTDTVTPTDIIFISNIDEEKNYNEELKKFNTEYSLDMKVPRICISPIKKIYLDEFIKDMAYDKVIDDPELQIPQVIDTIIAVEETDNGKERIEASQIPFSENVCKEITDKNDSTVEITSNKDDDCNKDSQSSSKFIIDEDDAEKDVTGEDDEEKDDTVKDNENNIKILEETTSTVEIDSDSKMVLEPAEKQTLDTETQAKEREIIQSESEKIHSNKENIVNNSKTILEKCNNESPIVTEDTMLPEEENAVVEDTDIVNADSCTSIETGGITENTKDQYDEILQNVQDKFDEMIEKTKDKRDDKINDVNYPSEETIYNSSKESNADVNNTQTDVGDITNEHSSESTVPVELNNTNEIEEEVTQGSPSHIVQKKSYEMEVDELINNKQDTEPNTDINYEGDLELTPETNEEGGSELTPEINVEGDSKSILETNNVDHTAQNISVEPDSTATAINTISLISQQYENVIESSDNEKIILQEGSTSDNETVFTVAKESPLKDEDIFNNDTTEETYFDAVIDADDDFDIFSIDVTGEKNKTKIPS